MRVNILIVMLVLAIVALPNLSSGMPGVTGFPVAGHPVQNHYYNFTSQPAGSYPTNRSWIGFTILNNSSSTDDQVLSTSAGNALVFTTYNFAQPSYLKMGMSAYNETVVSMRFEWNNSRSQGGTEDHIILMSGNSSVADLSFGSYNQYNTEIQAGNRTYALGYLKSLNKMINIRFYFSSNFHDYFYVSLENGSNQIGIPFMIPDQQPALQENLSLAIGGDVSNFMLYNISESPFNGSTFFGTAKSSLAYKTLSLSLPKAAGTPANKSRPFLDRSLNTIFYVTREHEIGYFNYYSNTSGIYNLASQNGSYTGSGMDQVANSLIYFFTDNRSMELIKIGLMNLSFESFKINYGSSSGFTAFNLGGNLLFINSTGFFIEANCTDLLQFEHGNLSFPSLQNSGLTIISANPNEGLLNASAYSPSEKIISFASFYSSNLSLAGSTEYSLPPFVTGLTAVESEGYINSVVSSISAEGVSSSMLTADSGKIYSVPGGSIARCLFSDGNFSAVGLNGSYNILSGNGSMKQTNLPYLGNNVSAFFSENLFRGVFISGNSIVVFFIQGSSPYSGYGISVTGLSEYVLHGNAVLNITVRSSLDYSLTATLENSTYKVLNTQDIEVGSGSLSNGTFPVKVTAKDLAGYASELETTVSVDNSVPSLLISPATGSNIPNFTEFSIRAYDLFGISSMDISYPGNNFSVSSGIANFTADFGNYTGAAKIKDTVTDGNGIKTTYSFQYTVVGFADSNFSINIYNGEYFNTSAVPLYWSPLGNVSHYIVEYRYSGVNATVSSENASYILSLPNGEISINLEAVLTDNSTENLYNATIFIETYSPNLTFSESADSAYSFFGNSQNDSFILKVQTNVSSLINARVVDPKGLTVLNAFSNSSYRMNISRNAAGFQSNGEYEIFLRAESQSGLYSYRNLTIDVNNTIPGAPNLHITDNYTNRSSILIPLQQTYGLRYQVEVFYGNYREKNAPVNNTGILEDFNSGQGEYNFSVRIVSQSGNCNYTNFSMFYYSSRPVVSVHANTTVLKESNSMKMDYSIEDSAPLESVSMVINGNISELNPTGSTGILSLNFSMNGNYSIAIEAHDRAGNSNSSKNVSVDVLYFVTVHSGSIIPEITGTDGLFRISLNGTNTGNTNITWFINGKISGYGMSTEAHLKYGPNSVKALIRYDGKSVSISRSIFVTGNLPIYAFLTASGIIAALAVARQNRDMDELENIIRMHDGKRIKDLLKYARKRRYSGRRTMKEINRLRSDGEARIDADPNQELYLSFRK